MKIISKKNVPNGRWRKYPWHKWFIGRPVVLTRGEDFDVSVKSMRVCIRIRANRDGYACRVHCKGEEITIVPT